MNLPYLSFIKLGTAAAIMGIMKYIALSLLTFVSLTTASFAEVQLVAYNNLYSEDSHDVYASLDTAALSAQIVSVPSTPSVETTSVVPSTEESALGMSAAKMVAIMAVGALASFVLLAVLYLFQQDQWTHRNQGGHRGRYAQ
ncbi:MAG: hypothetical protein SGI71_00920 [Verrucomicrobiota bacterium]|nr:hypothetical protein [Verrucomicrobiota bacterium]